jgi:hypothetical protein
MITKKEVEKKYLNKICDVDESGFIIIPIEGIKNKKQRNTKVYNIQVDEDESYIAGGVVVHNCGTMCGQTNWMRSKKIPAHKGFWVIEMSFGSGGIGKFEPAFYAGYK